MEGYQNLRQRRRPIQAVQLVQEQTATESGGEPTPEARVPETIEQADNETQPQQPMAESGEIPVEPPASDGPQTTEISISPSSMAKEAHRTIATTSKVEIVAELSANHNQNLDLAFQTLRAIAQAGADAVKLQSYDAQSLTLPLEQPPFTIEGDPISPSPWDGRSFYSLYQEAAMPWAWHKPLYKLADHLNLAIFSTPFCLRGVDFLEQLNSSRYKIASFEIGHLELIRRIAATGKPIIASIGIASFQDIERFLETCQQEGNQNITLLQCTSAYPASATDANLAMLPHLKATFGCRVGLSDHSMGSTVAITAVAMGAEMIEKHVILSRDLGGPDASFSLEPSELAVLIEDVRTAESAIGQIDYRLTEKKRASRRFGRSIFTLRDIRAGEYLQAEDVAVLRPFPKGAIEPQELENIIGAKLRCDVSYGTALKWHMLQLHEKE